MKSRKRASRCRAASRVRASLRSVLDGFVGVGACLGAVWGTVAPAGFSAREPDSGPAGASNRPAPAAVSTLNYVAKKTLMAIQIRRMFLALGSSHHPDFSRWLLTSPLRRRTGPREGEAPAEPSQAPARQEPRPPEILGSRELTYF